MGLWGDVAVAQFSWQRMAKEKTEGAPTNKLTEAFVNVYVERIS